MEFLTPIQFNTLLVLFCVLMLIALVLVFKNETSNTSKAIWTAIILILPIIGAILYFLKTIIGKYSKKVA